MRTFQTKNGKRKKIKEYMQYKLVFLFLAITLVFMLLIGLMLYRVVVHGKDDARTVLNQLNYSSTVIPSRRGNIYDCNMTPIAESEVRYILILDPSVINYNKDSKNTQELERYRANLDITVANLVKYFGFDETHLRETIDEKHALGSKYVRYLYSETKKTYSYGEIEDFLAYKQSLNSGKETQTVNGVEEKITAKIVGVTFEIQYNRIYPYNQLASKIIGFTGSDTTKGSYGIEQQYNDILVGTNGREYGYLNEEFNLERVVIDAIDGNNIVSTIDMNINRIISEQLTSWLKLYECLDVNVLAMDPNTGEIKAIVSATDYNLNNPGDLQSMISVEEYAAIANDAEKVTERLNQIWRNSVISDTYEPGSTAKVLTMAAALEENLVNPNTMYRCDGHLTIGGYKIKCHNYELGGCGDIDLGGALANSCNVAFMNMGASLGRTLFARYQHIFNLAQLTGIDLPGEASAEGLVFTEEQLNITELATSAFGQSFNVTMIQLATAYCSAINGGYYYTPHVVKAILDQNNQVVEKIEPTIIRQTVSESTSDVIREGTLEVIEEGTALGVHIDGYQIGGKTGAAQKGPREDEKYIVSTITHVPYDAPELVLYVVVNEPSEEYKGDSYPAQVLANWIWKELCPYLGIPSTEPNNTPIAPDDTVEEEIKDLPNNEAWNDSIIEEIE